MDDVRILHLIKDSWKLQTDDEGMKEHVADVEWMTFRILQSRN
jgi:hypothetical protein